MESEQLFHRGYYRNSYNSITSASSDEELLDGAGVIMDFQTSEDDNLLDGDASVVIVIPAAVEGAWLLIFDFSVETVYSLAYGVNRKLAKVNLNMTTCKLVIQKLLLQPLLSPHCDSSTTEKKNMPTGHGVKHCSSPILSLPMSWSPLPKVRLK
ncbi:hypothetical protein Q9966_003415 [Columba livia]|nr:hypothetical protein Q9966_003415 [Columba livia]